MKRALLSLSALFGLILGCCTQPREIRAATRAMQSAHRPAQVAARSMDEPESRPVDASYPAAQLIGIGRRPAQR